VAALRRVQANLKRYRAAVLKAACEGPWPTTTLEECFEVDRGRFGHRPRNEPRFYNGKYPFVQIGNLPRQGGAITTFTQTLNEQGLAISRMFPKGTVLIAIVGAMRQRFQKMLRKFQKLFLARLKRFWVHTPVHGNMLGMVGKKPWMKQNAAGMRSPGSWPYWTKNTLRLSNWLNSLHSSVAR
jgi:hypothetical protein